MHIIKVMYLICKHDVIPEQLVYIITNDAIVITFSSHRLAINRFIALITNEAIKWLDNRVEIESFWDRIDVVLAIGRAVVVICAFENKQRYSSMNRNSLAKGDEGISDTCGHTGTCCSFPDASVLGR